MTVARVISDTNLFQHLSNGQSNNVHEDDRTVHAWYRFVLSYPPHLVREYLQRFKVGPGDRVLDPFCGTGTTVVEAKKMNASSVGIEANPMAFFASSVKTEWGVDGEALLAHAGAIGDAVEEELSRTGFPDDFTAPLFQRGRVKTGELRGLPEEAEKILLRDSISPVPLHKTLILLEHINRKRDGRLRRLEQLALAKAVTGPVGNLHFGPEVGVGPKKADAPVISSWLANIRQMAEDLKSLPKATAASKVLHGDARSLFSMLPKRSISAVITSPPYPNEKDYTRTTRLESVLLGFIKNKAELRAFKENLLRSNTRNVFKGDADDQWIADYPEIMRIANEIEAKRIAMGKTSGFERLYARVTRLYFGGMARHLADLRPILRPGAQLAYVVGDQASYLRIMIRTGQLLAKIAESLGYEVAAIDLFRTRLATATKEQLREEVVVLRWPG